MKKRLISFMLATVIGAGVGAMSGCSEEDRNYKNADGLNNKNVYLVLGDSKGKTVHKGNYKIVKMSTGTTQYGTCLLDIKLDCGDEYLTNADCYIYENTPDKDQYDNVCEDCFLLD